MFYNGNFLGRAAERARDPLVGFDQTRTEINIEVSPGQARECVVVFLSPGQLNITFCDLVSIHKTVQQSVPSPAWLLSID